MSLKPCHAAFETEPRICLAYFEQMRFEQIAIELESRQIRPKANKAAAVIFKGAVFLRLGFPMETEVVLEKMIGEEVFLQIENFR